MTLTSLSLRAAEVGTPCVAAWLTSLRVSQVTFPVILLFPFREHERSTALRTRDFKVWHRGFSTRVKTRTFNSLALRSAGGAFLSTTGCGAKALILQTHAEKLASRRLCCLECTPAIQSIQFFCANFLPKSVADDLRASGSLSRIRHTDHTLALVFARHMRCSLIRQRMSRLFHKGPGI